MNIDLTVTKHNITKFKGNCKDYSSKNKQMIIEIMILMIRFYG